MCTMYVQTKYELISKFTLFEHSLPRKVNIGTLSHIIIAHMYNNYTQLSLIANS